MAFDLKSTRWQNVTFRSSKLSSGGFIHGRVDNRVRMDPGRESHALVGRGRHI